MGVKKERYTKNWSMVVPEKAASVTRTTLRTIRYSNYLEDYWPFADGLSAVNANGKQ